MADFTPMPQRCPLCGDTLESVACTAPPEPTLSCRCPSCGRLTFTEAGLAAAETFSPRQRGSLGRRLAQQSVRHPGSFVVINGPPEQWAVYGVSGARR